MSASYDIFKVVAEKGLRKHKGSCHCGSVHFEVIAPVRVTVYECSCETCWRRQFKYFEVGVSEFRLMTGHAHLATFDVDSVRHSFCSTCGVQCFCILSSEHGTQDKIGVMPNSIDPGTMSKIKIDRNNSKKSACRQPYNRKTSSDSP